MTYKIQTAVVLGAGTMGGGIAALLASVGIPVTLLDLPAQEGDRNRLVKALWERQVQARPAALFYADAARRVTLGNLEDDFDAVGRADWIVEAIIEQLGPKRELMARVDAARKPGSIVSSNTSGIPIHAIAEGRSEDFRRHFLGTHFFNPPRYLKLLEIIPMADTRPEVVAFMRDFGAQRLGKGVVIAKDRPNFIANRIGAFIGQYRMQAAIDNGYTVEEVDALTGPIIGNPKTGTFRLADLVGLDVMAHVVNNLYEYAPEDESRAAFVIPEVMQRLIAQNALGNKTGAGFYKKVTTPDGATEYHVLNLQTMQYEPPTQPRFDVIDQTKDLALPERIRAIFDRFADDRGGLFIVETTLPILAYAARRIPEIADSIADVDNAMRWGFNTEAGPFELWDMIGVRRGREMMRERDIAVPQWVDEMLAAGVESFYQRVDGRVVGVYQPQAHYAPLRRSKFHIVLAENRGTPRELRRNASASIHDLGDGILNLEFHSKGNTLDHYINDLALAALEMLERDEWRGLVVANQGKDFCLGANIGLFILLAGTGDPNAIENAVKGLQDYLMAFRFAPKPVVTAPRQRALGGGAEVVMAGARTVAAAETYIGLVEFGVGVIPAGGGCKELLRRVVSPHMTNDQVDALGYLQQVFETIAYAKVSESAFVARERGFLSPCDLIVMNDDDLIGAAKATAIHLAETGYTPPDRNAASIYAIGRRGKAAMEMAVNTLRWGQYISAHDALIARKLAHVLCGGDLSAPQWVTEQYILDLEREAFCSLLGEPKTQERISHMLKYARPLRN
ncbi:MAG: 3-hydroxyacyl-CoA dehydrogenase [Candidatus Thermofonsia Clade 3 bacterium]|jgi:3-hydroxyacyl-CoA dehydrogenase|uniref:3-hydroxyacyl-CoA dehydrogenase n=1 Tax=Candidatus Thermofonsia Clade 3 bacterium TaxID=2364212 RepID=A0A2M8QER7_9CHLR|nr:3-hydroxyacyl-CoA dehydrogenase/enoyl-CoA hydratase family protein [Candidatus Roseilinea sp. NK_OTU-006]PJF48303.1 MAG: 3-hydroxyacyl-CoA dehydrogenase [Candidatus Thermofonsia Clade 3 bacterium]